MMDDLTFTTLLTDESFADTADLMLDLTDCNAVTFISTTDDFVKVFSPEVQLCDAEKCLLIEQCNQIAPAQSAQKCEYVSQPLKTNVVFEEKITLCHSIVIPVKSLQKSVIGHIFLLFASAKELSNKQIQLLKFLSRDLFSQIEIVNLERQLFESKEIYRLITEGNPDIIFAKDTDYKIVFANQAFMSLYPSNMQKKIIGYTTIEGYDEEEAKTFLANDKLAFDNGFSETREKIAFPDGSTRVLYTTKTRFFDHKGTAFILGVGRDVTERENLIENLEKSNHELDQLAYVASHDLKAPLSAIKRLASWVIEDCYEQLPDDSKGHLDLLQSRCIRMTHLLDDLLAYSRVDRMHYESEEINLRSFVDNLSQLLDIPESFTLIVPDVQVSLPKMPLERIFINLISNAIKHHHKEIGRIEVTCSATDKQYVVSFIDDGPGIPEELVQKAFVMFQTLKPRDQVEGSGMGLPMVKKLIESYGGTVTLIPSSTGGCTFTLYWPFQSNN